MSYFYLKPVKGEMQIHLLEEIIVKRVEHLLNITRGDTTLYSEHVIEGSIHDNIGHFTLCIISSLLKRNDFTQFILHAEVLLFTQRISLSAYDLRCFCKKLLQSIRKVDMTLAYFEPLQKLCRYISIKNIASHICSTSHEEDCVSYKMKLYFKHCLPFIARRQVEVSQGIALVPCGRWMQYLVLLFKQGLLHRISQSKRYLLEHDPRMKEILFEIKKIFPLKRDFDRNVLMSKDIDKMSRFFPPCMLNLHQHLRKRHRLSHDQRFYYSLFLKDIGMPIEEAVEFWKSEYCQDPCGGHKCTHNWNKDEKKLVYGIRHMYGLEGAKKNYVSKSCKQIQGMDKSCHEGGCPFKSFDNNNMLKILNKDVNDPLLAQIFDYKEKKMYSSACLLFLQKKSKTYVNCDINSVNLSPVKYYTYTCKNIGCSK